MPEPKVVVTTGANRGIGLLITPEESARGLAERIASMSLENTGSFWHSNGEELPW